MARRIGLTAYVVTFKPVFKRTDPLVFARGGAFDAFDHTRRYLDDRLGKLVRLGKAVADGTDGTAEARALLVTRVDSHPASGVLEGLVETGEAGYASKIRDLTTEKLAHDKKPHEAEMPPFYFRFYFPDGQAKAILICQRLGRFGPRGALTTDLCAWFRSLDYTCKVDPFLDRVMLQKYLEAGSVRAVTLRAWKRPNENRELLRRSRLGGNRLDNGTELEVTLRPKGRLDDLTERVRGVVKGERRVNGVVSIEGLPDADEAIVEVRRPDGSSKKFSILRPDEGGISEDVTDRVDVSGGHPSWASIRKVARELCDDLASKLFLAS